MEACDVQGEKKGILIQEEGKGESGRATGTEDAVGTSRLPVIKMRMDSPVKRTPRSDCQDDTAGRQKDPETEDPETPLTKSENETKDSYQIVEVNKQIKELFKKRVELRKRKKEDKIESSESDNVLPSTREKPLPQRTPRIMPRVVSNIQMAPPRPKEEPGKGEIPVRNPRLVKRVSTDNSRSDRSEWSEAKRKKRRKSYSKRKPDGPDGTSASEGQVAGTSDKPRIVTHKPPKSAAVMILGRKEGFSYASALKKARESVSLDTLQTERTKIRKAANGGLLIEVMDPGGAGKAVALRDKLHEILNDQAIVSRPVTEGEVRLVGLDCTTSAKKVIDVVAAYTSCLKEDIKVGAIRPLNNGLFTAWVQCPLGAATRLAGFKKISIGWTMARVDLLRERPTQCFKCWRFGHLKSSCSFKEDFSGMCFRCGGAGHAAKNCDFPPCCKICLLEGKEHNQRIGSNLCPADQKTGDTGSFIGPGRSRGVTTDRRPETLEIDETPSISGQRKPQ